MNFLKKWNNLQLILAQLINKLTSALIKQLDRMCPYILGSSTDSAHLAGRKGLPYVFAGHFAPQQMKEAIAIYKELFEPSAFLSEPYVIVCLNAIVADTDAQAEYLATTQAQVMVSI